MAKVVEVDGARVEVTHPDRTLFPADGLTKGDLIAYYERVAPTMLPHLRDRPLNLERFPQGIGKQGFLQQDASDYFPDWVRTVPVPRREDGGSVDHVVCDGAPTLLYLANQSAVTLHAWASLAGDLERPDRVIFDLDPAADERPAVLRDGARALRDLLEEAGLVAFVQTSGSRGFHVVAPLARDQGFDEVRRFARDLAGVAAGRDPDRFTVEQRKAKRGGRVFIDVQRNAYAQTAVAPYSVRARPGAPVATPIGWEELGRAEPGSYTLRSVPRRLARKRDPWAGMGKQARPLGAARQALDRLLAGA